ncbi:MAG: DUF1295 domain-containing protein [Hyphomicrobiaceae bacterium]|nr:DUF1295 domain-containing protein [Hyphomicrobiaceae bacterium]
MHGVQETSSLPRTIWTIAHLLIVCAVAWLYFGNGIQTIGRLAGVALQDGDPGRRVVLMAFSVILFARMTYTAFGLLERRFDWSECVAVIGAVAFYQFGFALMGATSTAPLGISDLAAVSLFALGGYLNTGSEIERKRFKQDPANKGKLYTQELFVLVRHPNYLGDIVWALGWALMTRNGWALFIPAIAACGFIVMFIPQLFSYLAERYGQQYREWAGRTKRLIPFLY